MKPEWAGLAMAMSSVTVVSLSLMLKRYRPPASRSIGAQRPLHQQSWMEPSPSDRQKC
jgi:Cu+-exporting ATPase